MLQAGSFGTSVGTFCQGNDSRLSDARTPVAHTHTKSQITDMPTKLSDFTNDSGFITKSVTIGTVQPTDGTMWYKEI